MKNGFSFNSTENLIERFKKNHFYSSVLLLYGKIYWRIYKKTAWITRIKVYLSIFKH